MLERCRGMLFGFVEGFWGVSWVWFGGSLLTSCCLGYMFRA
jgi:hypothetical protein